MKSMSIQKQQGMSLVELLLVLGVVALIAIAAFIIFPSVQAGAQANTEGSNATAIVAGVKNLFGAKGNYDYGVGGDLNTIACQAQIFPSTMVKGATGATCSNITTATPASSAWGEDVFLEATTPFTEFTIHYTEVPSGTCTKLLSNIAANFDTVSAVSATGTDIKASGQSPDPVAIAEACAAANPVPDLFLTSK